MAQEMPYRSQVSPFEFPGRPNELVPGKLGGGELPGGELGFDELVSALRVEFEARSSQPSILPCPWFMDRYYNSWLKYLHSLAARRQGG